MLVFSLQNYVYYDTFANNRLLSRYFVKFDDYDISTTTSYK